jgi:hypothetical protein
MTLGGFAVRLLSAPILILAIACCAFGQTYSIQTLAGNGTLGDNGPAPSAELNSPYGAAVDAPALTNCSYTLYPGGQSFPVTGGSGTITVTAPAGCPWTATSSLGWVTVTGASSGQGNGRVTYQVAKNTGASQTGTLSVGGGSFVVEQDSATASGMASAGSMAQLASGGLWNTTITLVNTGSASEEVVVNFFGDDGSPLTLPLVFPQNTTFAAAAPLLATTLDETVAAGAQLVIQTAGQPAQTNVEGWAQVLANGIVGGSAVYAETTTTGTQEAVVPLEARDPSAFVLPFDYTGGYQTGIALANVTDQAVTVPVGLFGATGASLGTAASIQLGAYAHTAFMLASNYPAVASQYGAMGLEMPTGGQISALGIRAAPDGAITTVPVLATGAASNGSMAQIASGGTWNTTFTLMNMGATPAQVTLNFTGDNGTAVQMPLVFPLTSSTTPQSMTTLTQTIAPAAQLVIQTAGTASQATAEGYAQLKVTGGSVGGSAVFDDTTAAGVQEAIVPVEADNPPAFLLPFNYTNGYQTGVAVANLSNQAATIQVVLRDATGASLGTAPPIQLGANAHTAFMLATQYPAVEGLLVL